MGTNDNLYHSGTPQKFDFDPHGSGRYRQGSGEHPYQHEELFLKAYREAKAAGKTDKEFYESRQMGASEFRSRLANAKNAEKTYQIQKAQKLYKNGWSKVAIAKEIFNDPSKESTIRNWINKDLEKSVKRSVNLANHLEEEIKEKGCIDVGTEVNRELSANPDLGKVSETRLNAALVELKDRGYEIYNIKVPQITNKNQNTTVRVAAMPGTTKNELYSDLSKIKSITTYTPDNGEHFWTPQRPANLDSSRVYIRYREDGGEERDGTIELRRGVDDLSLGSALHAQVRIAVDGTHYIKGMALYSDDIPDGYDLVVNTNKKRGTPVMDPNPDVKQVLKPMKSDPDNPFGALIKAQGQRTYIDKNGKEKLSPINLLREEGDWEDYSKTLSSQFLSKQKVSLIKTQLKLTKEEYKEEFDELRRLTNPAVKQKLLAMFAEKCDKEAVDLKATALPRQSTKVILPLTTLKDNEIYAPTYKDGEHVVLIRYPHAGTFEIPELIVNNKNKEGKSKITDMNTDAVGITKAAADQLSGADFDGDHVIVIPVGTATKITTSPAIKGLRDFSTTDAYQYTETKTVRELNKKTGKYEDVVHYYRNGKEYKPITEDYKQIQMGVISNLITDMTAKGINMVEGGASQKEIDEFTDKLARAVRHSMVIIDSEKHKLDYHQSYVDNKIGELHEEFQGKKTGGAATLISKAGKEIDVPKRRRSNSPDPETGEWIYTPTGEKRVKLVGVDEKTGKKIWEETDKDKTEKVEWMRVVKDARELSSGNLKDELYAEFANSMKAMANEARKEAYSIKSSPRSASAAQIYAQEVKDLNSKLNTARLNAPKERQAQIIANQVARAKWAADPSLDDEHKKRIAQQELTRARALVGANKKYVRVNITEKEWEAIQAGAISTNQLKQILDNADMDKVRSYATPNTSNKLSDVTKRQIASKISSGKYTVAQIAEAYGVSAATVSRINKELKGGSI